ncbi:MAG: pitrilysin family protein [Verrucomicrobiota bacterium]
MNRFLFSRIRFLMAGVVAAFWAWSACSKMPQIDFVEFELPNGLHVILHANDEAPVVSSYILYHVGSKDERADMTGFAHFFEHLMFEGSKNVGRKEGDRLISEAGGNKNASTSFDRTDYYINLPSNELELALWIESERMLHAEIGEIGVETQREVVKEERRSRYENQPFGTFVLHLAKTAFEGTSYEWTAIGDVEHINKATLEEFRKFYNTWYVPNNATLSIAGDIDIEKTKKLVERYYGDIPKGADIERVEIDWVVDRPGKTVVVEEPMTPLPASIHVWPAPPMTHEDANALDLAISILATGKSSRIYNRLVAQERAAVSSSAFAWLQEKVGMVAAYAIGNSGVPIETLDELMDEEVQKLVNEGISDREFQKALNQKESELASSLGTMQSRATSLAYYHQWYGDANRVNTELDEYLSVTKEDVIRVAKKYLVKERRSTIHYVLPENGEQ